MVLDRHPRSLSFYHQDVDLQLFQGRNHLCVPLVCHLPLSCSKINVFGRLEFRKCNQDLKTVLVPGNQSIQSAMVQYNAQNIVFPNLGIRKVAFHILINLASGAEEIC